MSKTLKPEKDFYQQPPEDLQMIMTDIGHMIGGALPKGYGFNLLIFDFGGGGSTYYISNGQRQDILKLMKEFITKQENK